MLEGPGERRGTGEGRRENRTPAHHAIHLWLSGGWFGGVGALSSSGEYNSGNYYYNNKE